MVNNIATHSFIPNILYSWKNGRTTYPVNPALSVYAHFKYVEGIPSNDAHSQVPLNKLRLLDLLIDRLNKMQTMGKPVGTSLAQQKAKSDNIEANINFLQQELKRSLQASRPFFTGQYNTEAGLLFNIYA